MAESYFIQSLEYKPNTHEVLLQGGNFNVESRIKMDEWVTNHPSAYYIKHRGRTLLNGHSFFNTIVFESEEDKLVFVLKFSEYVYA